MNASLNIPNLVKTYIHESFFYAVDAQGRSQLWLLVGDREPVLVNIQSATENVENFASKTAHHHVNIAEELGRVRHVHLRENAPGQPRLFNRGNCRVLNLWTPHRIEQIHLPQATMPSVFEEFMVGLVPDKFEREHLIKWLAIVAMRPWVKMNHGVMLRSDPGVGKDRLLQMVMGRIMGNGAIRTVKLRDVTGQFNSDIALARLINITEVYKSEGSEDALKHLITGERMRVEAKYQIASYVDSYAAYTITSNDQVPLHLSQDDRRWFVLDWLKKPYGEAEDAIRKFQELTDAFELGGAEFELASYFEYVCRKMEDDGSLVSFCQNAPMTKAKAELFASDEKAEQMEVLKETLGYTREHVAYHATILHNTLARDRSNRLSKSDIVDALREEGYERVSIRLEEGPRRLWKHPSATGAPSVYIDTNLGLEWARKKPF